MTSPVCVLSVLGWCWVDFGKSTQFQSPDFVALRAGVLSVLGLSTRARMRNFFKGENEGAVSFDATSEKPNTPNTLNTNTSNPLKLLSFKCVGFVLSSLNVCWVLLGEAW